jgi:hypothetical protein
MVFSLADNIGVGGGKMMETILSSDIVEVSHVERPGLQ